MTALAPTGLFHLERTATPCGVALLVTAAAGGGEPEAVVAVAWEEDAAALRAWLRRHHGEPAAAPLPHPAGSPACRAFQAYWEGAVHAIDAIEVRAAGTPFQQAVWRALRDIPAGTTLSYGALAARLQRARAVRAVGLANGANPISIIVPCHRVIGADGSLTGYGGGLPRKRWLLEHEARHAAPLGSLSRTGLSQTGAA